MEYTRLGYLETDGTHKTLTRCEIDECPGITRDLVDVWRKTLTSENEDDEEKLTNNCGDDLTAAVT